MAVTKLPVRHPTRRNWLVEQNYRLVHLVVSQMLRKGERNLIVYVGGIGQAESIGFAALLRAAELWDPSRTRFSTYAIVSIQRRIRNTARDLRAAEKFRGKELSLDSLMERYPGMDFPDPGTRVRKYADPNDLMERVLAEVENLPEPHRTYVKITVLSGRNCTEAAPLVGKSKAWVADVYREAVSKLRRKFPGALPADPETVLCGECGTIKARCCFSRVVRDPICQKCARKLKKGAGNENP